MVLRYFKRNEIKEEHYKMLTVEYAVHIIYDSFTEIHKIIQLQD